MSFLVATQVCDVDSKGGAWTPQVVGGGRLWEEIIFDELRKSMESYDRVASAADAEALVVGLLGDPLRSVLILGNRLIVDRRFLLSQKRLHLYEFVRSVMERHPLPNVAFQWEWNADGITSEDALVRGGCATPEAMPLTRVKKESWAKQRTARPLPRVVIAKKYGYDQCGILMPNPYFDDLTTWGKQSSYVSKLATEVPFEDRDARVFWRGAIRTVADCQGRGRERSPSGPPSESARARASEGFLPSTKVRQKFSRF